MLLARITEGMPWVAAWVPHRPRYVKAEPKWPLGGSKPIISPDPGKSVVRGLIAYERNVVLFQNQRFPTRQSMSFLKGEIFLFFSHQNAQT